MAFDCCACTAGVSQSKNDNTAQTLMKRFIVSSGLCNLIMPSHPRFVGLPLAPRCGCGGCTRRYDTPLPRGVPRKSSWCVPNRQAPRFEGLGDEACGRLEIAHCPFVQLHRRTTCSVPTLSHAIGNG